MAISKEMDKQKVKCFVDERNLLLGEMWRDQLLPSMISSRYFVAFVSQAYLKKVNEGDTNYCFKEYNDAKNRGVIIILILFNGVQLPREGMLNESVVADYRLQCTSATPDCIPLVVQFLSDIINNDPHPRPIQNHAGTLTCSLHKQLKRDNCTLKCSLNHDKGKIDCACGGLDQHVMADVSDECNNCVIEFEELRLLRHRPSLRIMNYLLGKAVRAIEEQWFTPESSNTRRELIKHEYWTQSAIHFTTYVRNISFVFLFWHLRFFSLELRHLRLLGSASPPSTNNQR
jgi:hypothetical protein